MRYIKVLLWFLRKIIPKLLLYEHHFDWKRGEINDNKTRKKKEEAIMKYLGKYYNFVVFVEQLSSSSSSDDPNFKKWSAYICKLKYFLTPFNLLNKKKQTKPLGDVKSKILTPVEFLIYKNIINFGHEKSVCICIFV